MAQTNKAIDEAVRAVMDMNSGARPSRDTVEEVVWEAVKLGAKAAKRETTNQDDRSHESICAVLSFLVKLSGKRRALRAKVAECVRSFLSSPSWIYALHANQQLLKEIHSLLPELSPTSEASSLEQAFVKYTTVTYKCADDDLQHALEFIMAGRNGMKLFSWAFPPASSQNTKRDEATAAFRHLSTGVGRLVALTKRTTVSPTIGQKTSEALSALQNDWPNILAFLASFNRERPLFSAQVTFVASNLSEVSEDFAVALQNADEDLLDLLPTPEGATQDFVDEACTLDLQASSDTETIFELPESPGSGDAIDELLFACPAQEEAASKRHVVEVPPENLVEAPLRDVVNLLSVNMLAASAMEVEKSPEKNAEAPQRNLVRIPPVNVISTLFPDPVNSKENLGTVGSRDMVTVPSANIIAAPLPSVVKDNEGLVKDSLGGLPADPVASFIAAPMHEVENVLLVSPSMVEFDIMEESPPRSPVEVPVEVISSKPSSQVGHGNAHKVGTCAKGHCLQPYVSEMEEEGNICDGCGRMGIVHPERIFRCEQCDFDLCQACFNFKVVPGPVNIPVTVVPPAASSPTNPRQTPTRNPAAPELAMHRTASATCMPTSKSFGPRVVSTPPVPDVRNGAHDIPVVSIPAQSHSSQLRQVRVSVGGNTTPLMTAAWHHHSTSNVRQAKTKATWELPPRSAMLLRVQ
jgi:hypothetical protein